MIANFAAFNDPKNWAEGKQNYKRGDRVTVTRHCREFSQKKGQWVEYTQKPFNGIVLSYWRNGQYYVEDESNRTHATYSEAELKRR